MTAADAVTETVSADSSDARQSGGHPSAGLILLAVCASYSAISSLDGL
jgi:hypothetical protein